MIILQSQHFSGVRIGCPLFIANLGYAFKVNNSFVIWDHFKVSWASLINANKQKAITAKFTFTFFLPVAWCMNLQD